MERSNKWTRGIKVAIRTFTVLIIAAAVTGMSITPVMADGRGGPGRGHGKHWKHPRHRRYVRPAPVVVAPAPVYVAPPPVVYAPPPPPPGISLVFPITIR
jgi:hypothetical protein